ncbi:MAG: chemotaxis protein CheC, partial [Peptococcaceae bacterium]|nr:chemotaxis protein CheC [Peptococcaceae bacterium]
MSNSNDLTPLQSDALREITNIGAGHAATALSQLLGTSISLNVPVVNVASFQNINLTDFNQNNEIVAVYLKVTEGITGKALFLFDPKSAERIATLLHAMPDSQELVSSDIALSALKEVGNILLGSFLAALAEFFGLKFNVSVPAIAVDMTGAIFDGVMLDGEFSDDWVVIETKFDGNHICGTMVFLPDNNSL